MGQVLKEAVQKATDKLEFAKTAFYYSENRATNLCHGKLPMLPWLVVCDQNYIRGHYHFNYELFHSPVKLANVICSYL
jgi:hypothetical protein